jgi:hypothetical protein
MEVSAMDVVMLILVALWFGGFFKLVDGLDRL